MSSTLWHHFLRDDADGFQRFLANASFAPGLRATGGNTTPTPNVGSPGTALGSPPGLSSRSKKTTINSSPDRGSFQRITATPLSRAQVNARDQFGRTLLHLIASSPKPSALKFAAALIEVPVLDIYVQDLESGWTALHRALYVGNVAISQALMARDLRDATDFPIPGAARHPTGGLIKIKDREGNSPFDVYGLTILPRFLKQGPLRRLPQVDREPSSTAAHDDNDALSSNHSIQGDDEDEVARQSTAPKPRVILQGDEVFTFGSNKNLTLGLGDEGDRQYPEKITVERPQHLLQRFFRERENTRLQRGGRQDMSTSQDISWSPALPFLIRSKPIIYRDIVMSKLHTAVLTDDPESNLFMCGFGPGGRLGTGDESTRFNFVCIETGALAGKRIASVALGQDHSIATSDQGEVFTWGNNKYGQLGYNLPRTNDKNDAPVQRTPRQIFNPFKREVILGVAASSIHSVVFSASSLYTFGKNEGQLGLVDSDARSLEIQVTPRRVGISLFSCPIHMVSAIDRATTVLLESHDVWVFMQYGYSKVILPLDVGSSFIKNSFLATRYGESVNRITKVRSGGNTICAMSSFGEVYTVKVTNQKQGTGSIATSTTNPAKIRNSLSSPVRVWSVRKSHMAVTDVDVEDDGSIIICTNSGYAWRKEKRAKIKEAGSKDYKFARVPGLSRVVGVRSNAFGAFAVSRRDCEVTREIQVDPSSLWHDFSHLLPFKEPGLPLHRMPLEGSDAHSSPVLNLLTSTKEAILSSADIELHVQNVLQGHELSSSPQGTVWISSTQSGVRIPVHEFILTGRSPVLRKAFTKFRQDYYFTLPDVFSLEYGGHGQIQLVFYGFDFLSILNLIFFIYSDSVLDVWRQTKRSPKNAFRYRQVRTEVMRFATYLELRTLERAVRIMIEPTRSLNVDIELAITDPSFFSSSDVTIELDGDSVQAHSHVICQRCPFFDGLFRGRSGGRWLASRWDNPAQDKVNVDLKDISPRAFAFVLRHIYADTEEALFEDVRSENIDDFIDLLLDVMSAANELMIDRLAQVCQKMLGRFVNTRNVCYLMNAVAPYSVTSFKDAALEYICLNLETMLENRLLDDLNDELLLELVGVCQENQLACYPVSRTRNTEDFVFEKYPKLSSLVEIDRQRRIDSMRLRSKVGQEELHEERFRVSSFDKMTTSPLAQKIKNVQGEPRSMDGSPILHPKQSAGDLMFQMDEDSASSPTPLREGRVLSKMPSAEEFDAPPLYPQLPETPNQSRIVQSPAKTQHYDNKINLSAGVGSPSIQPIPGQSHRPIFLTPETKISRAPWGQSMLSGAKRDLKDIMVEASQSRVSNLTLVMSDQRTTAPGGSFVSKLSQKERKRLQQQQVQETFTTPPSSPQVPQSPWQNPGRQVVTGRELSTTPNRLNPSTVQTKAVRRPSMTLRQTVAGVTPKNSRPRPTPSPTLGRNVSAPLAIGSMQPVIQSIRHNPRQEPKQANFPSSASGPLSLASIVLQQQAEKDEIREAATVKHSLQDIQIEQQFQEWWDKESKRVIQQVEAEAAADAQKEDKRKGPVRPSWGSTQGTRW